jgi:hypothetical protein
VLVIAALAFIRKTNESSMLNVKVAQQVSS